MRQIIALLTVLSLMAATTNADSFRVVTQTRHASRYDRAAEAAYVKQAKFWFGEDWSTTAKELSDRCEITVREGRIGNGGATTFTHHENGAVDGWDMRVQGTPERLADSIIPHEVNHVVFHAHFGRPLPRFFDEGAAALWEHPADIANYQAFLRQANGKFIAMRDVIDAKEYSDNMERVGLMYGQGYYVTRHLVTKHGAKKFIAFLTDDRKPTEKLSDHFGVTPEELDKEWHTAYYSEMGLGQQWCNT